MRKIFKNLLVIFLATAGLNLASCGGGSSGVGEVDGVSGAFENLSVTGNVVTFDAAIKDEKAIASNYYVALEQEVHNNMETYYELVNTIPTNKLVDNGTASGLKLFAASNTKCKLSLVTDINEKVTKDGVESLKIKSTSNVLVERTFYTYEGSDPYFGRNFVATNGTFAVVTQEYLANDVIELQCSFEFYKGTDMVGYFYQAFDPATQSRDTLQQFMGGAELEPETTYTCKVLATFASINGLEKDYEVASLEFKTEKYDERIQLMPASVSGLNVTMNYVNQVVGAQARFDLKTDGALIASKYKNLSYSPYKQTYVPFDAATYKEETTYTVELLVAVPDTQGVLGAYTSVGSTSFKTETKHEGLNTVSITQVEPYALYADTEIGGYYTNNINLTLALYKGEVFIKEEKFYNVNNVVNLQQSFYDLVPETVYTLKLSTFEFDDLGYVVNKTLVETKTFTTLKKTEAIISCDTIIDSTENGKVEGYVKFRDTTYDVKELTIQLLLDGASTVYKTIKITEDGISTTSGEKNPFIFGNVLPFTTYNLKVIATLRNGTTQLITNKTVSTHNGLFTPTVDLVVEENTDEVVVMGAYDYVEGMATLILTNADYLSIGWDDTEDITEEIVDEMESDAVAISYTDTLTTSALLIDNSYHAIFVGATEMYGVTSYAAAHKAFTPKVGVKDVIDPYIRGLRAVVNGNTTNIYCYFLDPQGNNSDAAELQVYGPDNTLVTTIDLYDTNGNVVEQTKYLSTSNSTTYVEGSYSIKVVLGSDTLVSLTNAFEIVRSHAENIKFEFDEDTVDTLDVTYTVEDPQERGDNSGLMYISIRNSLGTTVLYEVSHASVAVGDEVSVTLALGSLNEGDYRLYVKMYNRAERYVDITITDLSITTLTAVYDATAHTVSGTYAVVNKCNRDPDDVIKTYKLVNPDETKNISGSLVDLDGTYSIDVSTMDMAMAGTYTLTITLKNSKTVEYPVTFVVS